jgi:hypothetical protein
VNSREAVVARSRDEVHGSLHVSHPPQLTHILGPSAITTVPEWLSASLGRAPRRIRSRPASMEHAISKPRVAPSDG